MIKDGSSTAAVDRIHAFHGGRPQVMTESCQLIITMSVYPHAPLFGVHFFSTGAAVTAMTRARSVASLNAMVLEENEGLGDRVLR
jgi:hypothetical protein